jgi:fatty-acyl-CoA synthase
VRAAREPASPRADRGRGILSYTSGTTGRPKGARRTLEANLADAVLGTLGALPLRAGERHLVVCPLYHSTAFGFASFASTLGGTLFLEPSFSATGFLERVDRDRITSTAVVPTMLHRLLDVPGSTAARYDLSSLRAVLCGGAPLPPSIAERFQERFGLILYNFYGSTETGINTLATPNDLIAAPGTVGRPVDGNDIRLWDDRGEEVDPGRVGTLYVRNRMLVSGYHRAPGATDASTRHGYFTVGDLAYRDDHGRLHIAGRGHDMIISGGVNVYPAEVEAALLRHPRIADAAVTGVPDEEWGERVVAFVVADPRPEEGELEAFVRDHLSAPKRPRRFVFVSELPRTPTGKVEKARLRSLL